MSAITASDVKALRDRTGAGMMACKNALAEADGDFERAVELLRARGEAQAAKRAGNEATEGTIQTYVHSNGKIGVLVEVDCETDFVARNDAFVGLRQGSGAAHRSGRSGGGLRRRGPAEEREAEVRVATEKAAERPENVREKIVEGSVRQVARRCGAAASEARQRGQVRRRDDRGDPREAGLGHRRERGDPPLRALPNRRLASARCR